MFKFSMYFKFKLNKENQNQDFMEILTKIQFCKKFIHETKT